MLQSGLLANTLRLLCSAADRSVRTRLLAAMLLVVIGALLSATAPLALKALIDALATAPPAAGLPAATLALGGAYLLALCCARLLAEVRPLLTGTAEQTLCARLGLRFFTHVLALPMAFHADRQTGALVQSLRQATMGCQLLVVTLVNSVVPVLVEVVAVLAVLLHLDQPALVLSFAASAVTYLIVCGWGAWQLRARARAVSEASLDSHATLADSLDNVETIKCFNAAASARVQFAAASSRLESSWMQLHRQRARTGLAVTATFGLSMAASLTLASQALGRGSLSLGGFVLITVYMLQLVRPLEMLGAAARDIAQALEFVRPLLDLLQMRTETGEPSTQSAPATVALHETPAAAWCMPPERTSSAGLSISLRKVHLAYGTGPPVLHGLNLDIAACRTVAIVGASGSGKTSIVRLLLRLHAPQSGRILIGGVPVDALPLDTLRDMFGVVAQDTVLFNTSIAANIGIARPGATRSDIEGAARRAHLHDFIASLPGGYDTPVGERGLKLSGGERQRVAIARAVLKRPRVFLFDEATSMLDSRTEMAIVQELKQLCQDRTTLIVAHRLSTVQHADEIVVLEQGKVAERGSPAALRAAGGAFARLWQAQMGNEPGQREPAAVPAAAPDSTRSTRSH